MPFFLLRCLHHEGMDQAREDARPNHRAWVDSGGQGLVCVLLGAALSNDAGDSIGNFGILEAKTEEDAWAFARGDAFAVNGIVSDIQITRLADKFQAHRIAEPMSPRLQN